jgi:hypothetical protein
MLPPDAAAAIDDLVAELLEQAGCDEPPVDAIALAQLDLDMTVCLDRRQPQRGRAERSAGRSRIYLRPEPRLERRQWTVAHEIGEHLRLELLRRLDLADEGVSPMAGEALANAFANRLLVPSLWYARDAPRSGYDLFALKERYATASHEVLAWRWLDLDDACIVTLVDNGHITRRLANAGPAPRALAPTEVECQQVVNETSRKRLISAGGWVVWGWPVHQADWRREILRSVPPEEA